MTSISIREAQNKLAELIHGLSPGSEIVITENDLPVARIVAAQSSGAKRQLGMMRGSVKYMAPDFDAPLDEFKEYME